MWTAYLAYPQHSPSIHVAFHLSGGQVRRPHKAIRRLSSRRPQAVPRFSQPVVVYRVKSVCGPAGPEDADHVARAGNMVEPTAIEPGARLNAMGKMSVGEGVQLNLCW